MVAKIWNIVRSTLNGQMGQKFDSCCQVPTGTPDEFGLKFLIYFYLIEDFFLEKYFLL